MSGKIVPLIPRTASVPGKESPAWKRIFELLQPEAAEMELCLHREITRVPEYVRSSLWLRLKNSDLLNPALFLTIARIRGSSRKDLPRLASSLESLNLALEAHRTLHTGNPAQKQPVSVSLLGGDFFFSLALSLASDMPVFIKGMAEIISRTVMVEVNQPNSKMTYRAWRNYALRKISHGRASLFAMSCSLGAWTAQMAASQMKELAYFGHYLGMGLCLKRDLIAIKQGITRKHSRLSYNLPLLYVLEHSCRRGELLGLFNKSRLTGQEQEILLREWEAVDPETYINSIAVNCLDKARQSLRLLAGSECREILSSFLELE